MEAPKIEGISPEMLWTALIVIIGLGTLYVLYGKVRATWRAEKKEKRKAQELEGKDITDQIAEKVLERLTPQIDEKFAKFDLRFEEIDKKLASDKETIEMHTRQLNEQEGRVSKLEGGNKALCHGMLALLESNPNLGKAQTAMKNYLIDGKYKEEDWN